MSNNERSKVYLTRISEEGAARAARLVHYDEGYQACYGAQGSEVALVLFVDNEGFGSLIAYRHDTGEHGLIGHFPCMNATTEDVTIDLTYGPWDDLPN